jgi:phosphocarrier protein
LAGRFQSDIEVVRDALRVDAKSILNVMTLAAAPGVELVIEARGVDAQEAVDKLTRFIENGFVVEDTPGQNTGGTKGEATPQSGPSPGKRFNKAPGPTGRQRDTASE